MIQCSDGSEEDERARARWSRKASWRKRVFNRTLEDGEDSVRWEGSAIGQVDDGIT